MVDDCASQTACLVARRGENTTFSPEARIEAGILLRRLQGGERLGMPHSRQDDR
jgi:hypothetical protein